MIAVVHEPWRADPLAWIHRGEAKSLAAELAASGRPARLHRLDGTRVPEGIRMLRVSDAVMLRATQALQAAGLHYLGPGAVALARCYDKLGATHSAAAAGADVPETRQVARVGDLPRPLVLKPRQGSDSIGLRVIRRGDVPARLRGRDLVAQPLVVGTEMTIGLLGGRAGAPLAIDLPRGQPYTFARKYLWRPRRAAVSAGSLYDRVQETALRIASALGVDWAARVDFIHEQASDRLVFLECDAAPIVAAGSAFADSLAAGGMPRAEQLRRLLREA